MSKAHSAPPRLCPWTDYANKPIHEGDTIRHPSGEQGVVVYVEWREGAGRWRVDYGDGLATSFLGLQIGERGQAVVVASK